MTEDDRLAGAGAKVEALLNPSNVVIVGASDKPGNWAQRVWRNLNRYGFPQPVFPYNPSRESIWDTRCYRRFEELPEPPDHLVLLVPARIVPEVLDEAARAGARSATVMTAGFDEAEGPAAAELSARLKRVIAATGLAVSGPNCLGNLNAQAQLMTMPDDRPQKVASGPVAIIGQSGGIAMAIKRSLEERGVDAGWVITSGNETGLTTADYIAYFATRPDVKAIVSYLESVHDAPAFLSACRLARAQAKSVVAMKLGASPKGREAALAHTGRLAGALEAFDAVAGAAGVLRVHNLDQVVEAVEFLVHVPQPKGKGLGAITFSGGLRGLLLDQAERNGLAFPPLSAATRERIEAIVSVGTTIGNPLDAGFAALTSQDAYLECIEAVLADPGIDVLLLQEELPRGPGTERKESNLKAVNDIARRSAKPIAFLTMISHSMTDYARALRQRVPHVAFLQEVDKSMAALRAIMASSAPRRAPVRASQAAASARRGVSRLLSQARPMKALNEVEAKALLSAYGIKAPHEAVAASETEAAKLARAIGFPVVAKALSRDLPHKSEAGAVLLNLRSAQEVREAFRRIEAAARRARACLEGVLIAEQETEGIELLLGMHRDPEMGPVILFGAGGTAVELDRDIAMAEPALDAASAEALIVRTRIARRLAGYRKSPALDRKALCNALIALSRLTSDFGSRIRSIDVNPFLLKRRGGVALDALVVLADGASEGARQTSQLIPNSVELSRPDTR